MIFAGIFTLVGISLIVATAYDLEDESKFGILTHFEACAGYQLDFARALMLEHLSSAYLYDHRSHHPEFGGN